jgi:hypothetical protein
MEEQRRFVEWEGTLNDRESALGSRERSLSRRESQAPAMVEEKPEPRPEPRTEPAKSKQDAVKAPVSEEAEELESESETFCPECRTIVSSKAESCYACGADLKNPKPVEPKPERKPEAKPEPKAEGPKAETNAADASEEHSADVKRPPVSIRKMIKRK